MAVTFDFTATNLEEQIRERNNFIDYLLENHNYNKVKVRISYQNQCGEWSEDRRIQLWHNEIFAYRKGKRRSGNYLHFINGSIKSISVPEKRKSKDD